MAYVLVEFLQAIEMTEPRSTRHWTQTELTEIHAHTILIVARGLRV